MPHQCVKCNKLYPDGSNELLKGCECGGKFFFFIREENLQKVKEQVEELSESDKKQIEMDVRDIINEKIEEDAPVILDLESVRVLKPGKFEIDIINLFTKRRPIIYILEEGKYIIDLASSLRINKEEIYKKIKDPEKH